MVYPEHSCWECGPLLIRPSYCAVLEYSQHPLSHKLSIHQPDSILDDGTGRVPVAQMAEGPNHGAVSPNSSPARRRAPSVSWSTQCPGGLGKTISLCPWNQFSEREWPVNEPHTTSSLHSAPCIANSLHPYTLPGHRTSSQRLTKLFNSMSFDSCLTTG